MSLRDLQIEKEYRNLHGNIVKDFFNPLLSESVLYMRSVGFFSSSALVEFSRGLCKFSKNGGKIKLVTSPKLSDEDIEAMKTGYDRRKEIIESAVLRELREPISDLESDRLNLLANLIANGRLDIKIAFTESGMYHEKLGVIRDKSGDYVSFSGSLNESANAFKNNYETIDVYCSWNDFENRAKGKLEAFEKIWNGKDETLNTFDFPKLKEQIVLMYKKSEAKYDMDEKEVVYIIKEPNPSVLSDSKLPPNIPTLPSWLNLHGYQKEAIENWRAQNYRGVFDMATGTGKTLTGLAALTELFEDKDGEICAVILCPYIHLVTQWVEDIQKFNIKPIIAFGSSGQKDWKDRLDRAVYKRNFKDGKSGFFCLVATVATFKSDYVQKRLSRIKKEILLIADEAHNLGSQGARGFLLEEKYKYRLALSATLDRHFDDEGTSALYEFFGTKCIEYGLEQAIHEGFLVPYFYHPIVVSLDDEERDKYVSLTKSISMEIKTDSKTRKKRLSARGKFLCILRSRIVASCREKIPALLSKLKDYRDKNMILIYCGAVKYDEDFYSRDDDESAQKQISEVIRRVYEEYQMKISRFTAETSIEDREVIKRKFAEGKELQAIAAIKCLDEGVNIPSIKTAFILASSTNPKEYIQRRGRVLRTFKGKKFAEIYDFVTLPYGVEAIEFKDDFENQTFRALAKNEVARMKEFSAQSKNPQDSDALIKKLEKNFSLNDKCKDLEEKIYG